MKNNTNKTMKQLFLAASVVLTMGVASAASVPGIPTNTFEFNQIDSNATPTSGNGFNAIANVNAILNSVGDSGGSNINVDNYWKSFVKPAKEQTFDYAGAKSMIEELVFTVTGEAYGAQVYGDSKGWHSADTVFSNVNVGGTFIKMDEVMMSRTSQRNEVYTQAEVLEAARFTLTDINPDTAAAFTQAELETLAGFSVGATRMISNGKIAETGEAAVTLLKRIGFSNVTTPLGSHTITYATDGSNTADVTLDTYPVDYVATPNTQESKRKLINTVLAAANTAPDSYIDDSDATVTGQSYSTTFADDAAAARVDAVAFANANNLIGQIAQQLKNGYLLDVVKATAAVDDIIDHHNNYLAASIVDQAKGLKDVMKNIGLQSAAVTVGKTAGNANVCGADGQFSTIEACVKIGTAFKDIALDINGIVSNTDEHGTVVSTSAASVTAYNDAIDAIGVFAGNLSDFNTAEVSAYNSVNTEAAIYGQFGDIMVIDGSEVDNALDGSLSDGGTGTLASHNPYTGASWTTESDADFDIDSGFEASINIEGLDVELH